MTKTRLIGDIHGKTYEYKLLIEKQESTIQLGDFGIGFAGDYWHEHVNELHADGNHRFIRGNHDDPERCRKEMTGYIPDGTIENDIFFMGGAWSIDWKYRVSGVDWWPDEELNDRQLKQMIETYAIMRPRVVITHDCPTLAAYHMFIRPGHTFSNAMYLTRTGEALQAMFEIHQPEYHFFGHWHHTATRNLDGTTFVCLGINDYIDVDLYDSDHLNYAVAEKFRTS